MDSMINMPVQGNVVPHSPISELRLYSGVPWDDSYEHVRLYESQNDLLSHLENWRVTTSTDVSSQMTPIRVGEQVVKVPYTEMSMLNINYLAFRNNITGALNNEWVFCFVTNVEWRSENTTRIHFKMDIWQNNIYNATLKPCFIERSHIPKNEDSRFSNLLPENLETGEYIQYSETNSNWGEPELCIYVSDIPSNGAWDTATPSISNNMFMSVQLVHDPLSTQDLTSEMKTFIALYNDAGKTDAILDMFIAPELCVQSWGLNTHSSASISLNIGSPFEGYTPENNKLYQYPYCFIRCDNNLGESSVYRWEYFTLDTEADAGFTEDCLMCTEPTVTTSPVQYKGSSVNYGESMTYNNFPTCAWASDTFRAWIAQNKGTMVLQGVNAAIGMGGAIASVGAAANPLATGDAISSAISSVQSSVNSIGNILNEVYQHEIMPSTMHGKVMQEAVNAGLDRMFFTYRLMSIKQEFAKCIDSYWSAFGYPIRKIQQPDYTSRSSWNYLKTVSCNVQGDIDLDQRNALKDIFDRGVTIWHTDDVGNYNLANN